MTIRSGFRLLAVGLVLSLAGAATMAGGEVSVFGGVKKISDSELEDVGVDSQSEFGITSSWDVGWPVMIAVDVLMSSDDSEYTYDSYYYYGYSATYSYDVDTTELNVGVRKFWGEDRVRPYVGGGLSYVKLDAEIAAAFTPIPSALAKGLGGPTAFSASDDDSGVGFFVNAGVLWRLGSRFHIGIDARWNDADADLLFQASPAAATLEKGEPLPEPITVDSGGVHVGVLLGVHW